MKRGTSAPVAAVGACSVQPLCVEAREEL